jgi:hypothetical protein
MTTTKAKTTDKLEALKAAMAAKAAGNSGGGFSNYFQFWRAPVDTTSVFRFLPDADESNPFQFFVENITHELIIDGEKKRVPCQKMHGESSCPICAHSSELYSKGKEAEKRGDIAAKEKWYAEGKKFYRKISYLGQGLVIDSPVEHDPDTIVFMIDFGPSIYELIEASMQGTDLECEPYDFYNGYNFRFKKTLKKSPSGDNANYATSSFSPKNTAIDDDLIAKIDLYDLKNQRQRAISRTESEQLLEAAINGKSIPAKSSSQEIPTKVDKSSDDDAPQASASTTEETTPKNNSTLASLRERAKAKAAAAASSEE